jgi:hypothetical protein
VRAVQSLEEAATQQARVVGEGLAKGALAARQTSEAQGNLGRLARPKR